MLSGIGAAEELKRHGIEQVVLAAEVGKNESLGSPRPNHDLHP
jgi:hypothetical protein